MRVPFRFAAFLLLLTGSAPFASAVRPFITDDARVVGGRQAQLETWMRQDRNAVEHWTLLALGPIEPLELTVGALQGLTYGSGATKYSVTGPLLQAKYLLRTWTPNSWPGVAISGGAAAPAGVGGFLPQVWDRFAYLAVTESLFSQDRVLVHGNVGGVRLFEPQKKVSWGVGSQVQARGGFHVVGEVFSGDPYADASGQAVQVGFRHVISEYIQIDATLGRGVSRNAPMPMPVWGSVGIRLVTPRLWGRTR